MAKPDRRMTFRLTDAEAAVIANIQQAQPHLTKSDVAHLLFADKNETVAAALRAVGPARSAVRLDQAALAALDGVAEGVNVVGRELRPLRSLANQMARASNSGDPLVAAELAHLNDGIDACLELLAGIARDGNGGTTWRS